MQDKVILITGATGALGRVVAQRVAATGARVALTGRRQDALDILVGELDAKGEGRIWAQAADLAIAQDVERLMSAVAERWGGVDILLNIAGGWRGGKRVADVTEEEWDLMLDMNLRSAFLINRAVLPYMVKQGWGRIINLGSSAAVEPKPRRVQYAVSKAGVVALTAAIAADYRRSGIAANVILPSIIDTPANRKDMPDADTSRWVNPEEIAALMLFLCSEAGGSLNGATIPVYGRV
jgi:NAD(P)-dependent dehydrogenase (short-subunit alcohol dehydrogenase family)